MLKRLNRAKDRAKEIEEEKRPKKSESIKKRASVYQEKLFGNMLLNMIDKANLNEDNKNEGEPKNEEPKTEETKNEEIKNEESAQP